MFMGVRTLMTLVFLSMAEAYLHHQPLGRHPQLVPDPGPHPLPRVGAFPVVAHWWHQDRFRRGWLPWSRAGPLYVCVVTRPLPHHSGRDRCHGGRMTQTVDFRGVPICRAGEWNGLTGKAVVTPADLHAVVDAYADGEVDKARVKLGHVSELNALGDGAPAFGWVENPRVSDDGRTLLGDLVDVPRRLGEVVGRAYKNVSVELRKNVRTPSGRTHPTVLSGLALLGAAAPAVKGLDDLAALYASEPIPPAPTDHCEDGAVVTIALGDALDDAAPVTRAPIPPMKTVAGDSTHESPGTPGPEMEGEPSMAFLDQAREMLGLPKDATEEQILAGMKNVKLSEQPEGKQTLAAGDEPEGEATSVDEAKAAAETSPTPETVTVSKAVLDEMNARIVELDNEAKARREAEAVKHRDEVIATALSEGRIVPAEREHWVTALSAAPEANEKLITSLAPRVNVTEHGSDVALSAASKDGEADEVDAFLDSLNLS